ncbi:1,4-alpha-glucan branching enzyme, partial [Pseudomonas frederiksbergensis]|nr:1,4-alpha-glucan branching enzyme [Pseudomonas frederiksbergensis]
MNATTRENGGLRQRDLDALARAEHADPFAVLGPHGDGKGGVFIRAFLPNALSARVLARHDGRVLAEMVQGAVPGLFTAHLDDAQG